MTTLRWKTWKHLDKVYFINEIIYRYWFFLLFFGKINLLIFEIEFLGARVDGGNDTDSEEERGLLIATESDDEVCIINFRYSENATKICPIFHLQFDAIK